MLRIFECDPTNMFYLKKYIHWQQQKKKKFVTESLNRTITKISANRQVWETFGEYEFQLVWSAMCSISTSGGTSDVTRQFPTLARFARVRHFRRVCPRDLCHECVAAVCHATHTAFPYPSMDAIVSSWIAVASFPCHVAHWPRKNEEKPREPLYTYLHPTENLWDQKFFSLENLSISLSDRKFMHFLDLAISKSMWHLWILW